MTSIIAIGDSLAFGVGESRIASPCGAWAGRLAQVIGAPHPLRFAWPGARIADVVNLQLDAALMRRPAIALISVGGNDAIRWGFDAPAFQARLHDAIDALERGAAKVVVLNLPDVARQSPVPPLIRRRLHERILRLNEAIGLATHGTNALVVDRWHDPAAYERAYLSSDRVHPSPLGYQRLAERTAKALGYEGVPSPVDVSHHDARRRLWLVTSGLPWAVKRSPQLVPGIASLILNESGRIRHPERHHRKADGQRCQDDDINALAANHEPAGLSVRQQ
ncbi:MAG: SGNH/GDSL hydrolase family protein [Candidatus Nanopelagicales bacterium]